MTLSQIKNFLLVAQELSYSSAAEKSFVSRQAIAKSIHELEKELNIVLFETDHTNRLSLTEIGTALLPKFEEVIEQTREIQIVADTYSQKRAPIRIAFSDSIAVFIFQDIIGMLYHSQKENPSVISEIFQESNLEIPKGNHQDADIILMLGKPFTMEGYTTEIVKSFDAVFSIPYTSSLYEKENLQLADLKGHTLICGFENNEELLSFAEENEITLLPMSNFYACSYTSIQKGCMILDVPFPSSDQTIIQKTAEGFSFSWDLLLLWKNDTSNPNIPMVKEQIHRLARSEKFTSILQGPS